MTGALNIPVTFSGRYRLERELGHGAMGYVYLARDLKHGRHVAVKVLAPETSRELDAERFLAEVHTAAGLTHPHILMVHDSGEEDGRLYYVMPRVEGESLRDLLDRRGRLPLAEAADIAHQVTEGLAYAHAHGIVHRDIKPGNILVDSTGHVYIADFGLALALSSVSNVRRTGAGVALGSPLYMSPEQAAGEATVDARSDIYAAGCVLFEMLAGAPPFDGTSVRDVMSHHVTKAPPLLRTRRADVPAALEREVQRSLAKDPADRQPTARAFGQVLEPYLAGSSGSGRSVPLSGATRATSRGGDYPVPESGLAAAFAAARDSRRVKWLIAYLVAGWLLLAAGPAMAEAFDWPPTWAGTFMVFYGLGALAFVLVPWLRAARGGPSPRQPEMAVLGALVLVGLISAGAILGTIEDGALGAIDTAGIPTPAGAGETELDPRRVAVLYFDERSPGGDSEYLAAGLTEGLINALTGVEGLEVLSKHAVEPYRERSVPLEEIVRALEAGTVVSGTVQQGEDELVVSIQLVEGATGTQRWSTSFERASGDLLEVQDRLVDEVARALRARLGYEFEVRRSRQRASSDAAWDLVQQGDAFLSMPSVRRLLLEDVGASTRFVRRADSMYAHAARLDTAWLEPVLRRAKVAEINSRLHRPSPDRRNRQYLERGIALTNAILGRDPGYAPARELRGRLRYYLAENTSGQEAQPLLESAAADLQRAVELEPSLALGWWNLSRVRWRQGWFPEAATAAEQALEADAFLEQSVDILHLLYFIALSRELTDEAIRWCDLGTQRHPDAQHFLMCRLELLAAVDSIPPQVDQAWALADSIVRMASQDRRAAFQTLGHLDVAKVAVRAGLQDSARAVLRRVTLEHDSIPDYAKYHAAHLYVMLGDRDDALRMLRGWADYRGPQVAASLANDWYFRPLHGDPAFDEVTGRSRDR